MTKFHLPLNRFSRGILSVAAFGCMIVAAGQSLAAEGNGKSACQFDSLDERTKNNPFSRAAYTALQWVEYEDKSERLLANMEKMARSKDVSRTDVMTVGLVSLGILDQLSNSHPLHRCFDEAFTVPGPLANHFAGMNFVKGRLALNSPYAMVIPDNLRDPVVLIHPTSMYRFYRQSGRLRVYDNERQTYVDVDPRARRGIDHLIQTKLAQLKN
jgi:hypothetical protein